MPFEKDPSEIGVLWNKSGAKGDYMTGTIEGIGPVVVFPIRSASDRAPNWRILKAQPKPKPQTATVGADDDGF